MGVSIWLPCSAQGLLPVGGSALQSSQWVRALCPTSMSNEWIDLWQWLTQSLSYCWCFAWTLIGTLNTELLPTNFSPNFMRPLMCNEGSNSWCLFFRASVIGNKANSFIKASPVSQFSFGAAFPIPQHVSFQFYIRVVHWTLFYSFMQGLHSLQLCPLIDLYGFWLLWC